jgi:hypothetical protein
MIIDSAQVVTRYRRTRNGVQEHCRTTRTVYKIRCDVCESVFTRTSKELNRRSSAHCCSSCDSKRFAQKQSAALREYNKWDASSSKTI